MANTIFFICYFIFIAEFCHYFFSQLTYYMVLKCLFLLRKNIVIVFIISACDLHASTCSLYIESYMPCTLQPSFPPSFLKQSMITQRKALEVLCPNPLQVSIRLKCFSHISVSCCYMRYLMPLIHSLHGRLSLFFPL